MASKEEVEEEEQEEDYMNMAIAEPAKPRQPETYTQRRLRKQREAELKQPKSKAERAAEEQREQELALSKPMFESDESARSKGMKMMRQMGFKTGDVLGKAGNENARAEPIGLNTKDDRGGVGMENERKRKFREEVALSQRKKVEETNNRGDFRERISREREEKRQETLVKAAQRVAEGFDSPDNEDQKITKPLASMNVLWRGLVRDRLEHEREKMASYKFHQSLGHLAAHGDLDEDSEDKHAIESDKKGTILEQDLDDLEDDDELEEFQALPPPDRLAKLCEFLRSTYNYCFWCKYRYPDESIEGCPGETEEDHD